MTAEYLKNTRTVYLFPLPLIYTLTDVNFCFGAAGLVHDPHMDVNSVRKCKLSGWKISCPRISTETHIPLLEPP